MTRKTGKDLMKAAQNADYKAIKACLDDGVPANYIEKGAFNEDPITLLLGTAGFHEGGSDTQTMKCIKLLFEHGADLNHVGGGDGGGYTPMDAPDITEPNNPLDLFNAVKFVLTHGGKNRRNRDYVMRDFESYGIMSKEQFEQFEKEGETFLTPEEKERQEILKKSVEETNKKYQARMAEEIVKTCVEHYGSDHKVLSAVYSLNGRGNRHGPFEQYYRNGQLEVRGTYNDGKANGLYEAYYENGQLKEKGIFENGEKSGVWELYNENARLSEKLTYKKGLLIGPYEEYYKNGQLMKKGVYNGSDRDQDGSYEEYYENGQLKKKASCLKCDMVYDSVDYVDGLYEEYYKNGQLFKKETYKDGKLIQYEEYRENGQLYEKRSCKGERVSYELYDTNGDLAEVGIMNGRKRIPDEKTTETVKERVGLNARLQQLMGVQDRDLKRRAIRSEVMEFREKYPTKTAGKLSKISGGR